MTIIGDPIVFGVMPGEGSYRLFLQAIQRAFVCEPRSNTIHLHFDTIAPDHFPYFRLRRVDLLQGQKPIRFSLGAMRAQYGIHRVKGCGFGSALKDRALGLTPALETGEATLIARRDGLYALRAQNLLHPVFNGAPSAHERLAWAEAFGS